MGAAIILSIFLLVSIVRMCDDESILGGLLAWLIITFVLIFSQTDQDVISNMIESVSNFFGSIDVKVRDCGEYDYCGDWEEWGL